MIHLSLSIKTKRPWNLPGNKLAFASLTVLAFIAVYASSTVGLTDNIERMERSLISPSVAVIKEVSAAVAVAQPPPERIDICFITSIFGASAENADQPHDMTTFRWSNETSYKFFLYTNMEDFKTPGWTKIVRKFDYRRYITQSRWGKFMAWKDPEIQGCKTVFYQDGHYAPRHSRKKFVTLAKQIHESKYGLAQRLVEGNGKRPPLTEFRIIRALKKDIPSNIEKSIEWLKAQPDFHNNCTLYENCYFGYNPTNVKFQRTTQYFWDKYSKEEDSWRDQPLWCYAMQHNDMHPLTIGKMWFKADDKRRGSKGHIYSAESDNDAAVDTKSSSATASSTRSK